MHGAGRACQAHLAEYVEIGTRSALLNTGMPCQAAKWDAGETWHAIWGNGVR